MENQLEPGHCCPIVMTAAAIPLLQRVSKDVPLVKTWLDKIYASKYDPSFKPVQDKQGVTVSMCVGGIYDIDYGTLTTHHTPY
ncbi:hypothetical protein EON63_16590 [archaeon]|nr:MAG: hypothetical protein EON63_16590 [archaeon]